MYAVIMAGGQGTRLWPLSRQKKPKQFHSFITDKPLIRETYERLLPKIDPQNIIISTTKDFVDDIKRILPEVPDNNIIVESKPIGTAGACGLISQILYNRDKNSVAVFLPSDHIITDNDKFLEVLEYAEKNIKNYPDHLMLIGINPTSPDTNLGYIQMDSQLSSDGELKLFSVKRFVEKPDQKTAESYLASWQYLWNAGMFIWRNDLILKLLKENMAATASVIAEIAESYGTDQYFKVFDAKYKEIEKTSIDYGVMEKTKDILVIPADFGWSDIGSWGSLLDVLTNLHDTTIISKGNHISVNSTDSLILANDKLIATVGLQNIVVIDTPDALLICNSKESHQVKDLLAKLKEEGKHLYL